MKYFPLFRIDKSSFDMNYFCKKNTSILTLNDGDIMYIRKVDIKKSRIDELLFKDVVKK
jgi:hypothetical protein